MLTVNDFSLNMEQDAAIQVNVKSLANFLYL
jgi:hypothetical protein